MRNIILLILIVATTVGGLSLYAPSQYKITSLFNNELQNTKCTTADGTILYGETPENIECQKIENIDGAISIVRGNPSNDQEIPNTRESARCDGRTHCSQMRSCEEALFFLNNCPNAVLDGDNDGVPCERQWCG